MTGLPSTIDAVHGAWLTTALRRAGQIYGDGEVTIRASAPLATGTAFSTVMYRLSLTGPTGTPASAIIKLPVGGPIRQLLDGIGAYVREVTFYRELADTVPVRVPKPYIAEIDEDSSDFVLAIEDLSHLEPADQLAGLTLMQARTAVENLARFHAWSWEHERLTRLADRFPTLDGEMAQAVYGQFTQFFTIAWQAARELPVVAEDVKQLGDRYAELMPFFIEQLATPRTIAHGELRAENLFLTPDGGLLMIDFQTVAQHAGIVDVAYLVAGSITPDLRRDQDHELVRRYHAGLETAGGGTTEKAIYRHFGSKAELFTAAVVRPFVEMLGDYTVAFGRELPTGDSKRVVAPWITELYTHLSENRKALLALISSSGDPEAAQAIGMAVTKMDQMFDEQRQLSRQLYQTTSDFRPEPGQLWATIITGMLISLTALAPIVLSQEATQHTDEELIASVCDLIFYGVYRDEAR